MVGELVIHIGDCKTGTTSIQAVLAKRQWQADGQDISYNVPFNHLPLAASLVTGGLERIRRCQREAVALQASSAPFGVISAENFEFIEPVRLKEAIDEFFPQYRNRLRIVAYVRPHLDRILSTYAERTKKGEIDLSLEEFARQGMRRGRFQYHKRFEKWRGLFGDRFTLRPFIRDELVQGDVVADFFTFLLRGAPFTLTPGKTQNESLSVEDLVMMRRIQRHMTAHGKIDEPQRAFGWNFSEILGAAPNPPGTGTKLKLHRPLAERLVEHYRADAELLDRDYFADRDRPMTRGLERSLTMTVPRPISTDPADYHDPAALRLIDCWAQFMIRMAAADEPAYLKMASSPEYRVAPVVGPGAEQPGPEQVAQPHAAEPPAAARQPEPAAAEPDRDGKPAEPQPVAGQPDTAPAATRPGHQAGQKTGQKPGLKPGAKPVTAAAPRGPAPTPQAAFARRLRGAVAIRLLAVRGLLRRTIGRLR